MVVAAGVNLPRKPTNIPESMENENNAQKKTASAYSQESYPPMPTKFTLFFRRCILYQAWRMLVLNIKILRIVVGGHS